MKYVDANLGGTYRRSYSGWEKSYRDGMWITPNEEGWNDLVNALVEELAACKREDTNVKIWED